VAWQLFFRRGLDAGLSHTFSLARLCFSSVIGCIFPANASNLLAACAKEDFSMRARGARSDDAMGEVMIESMPLGEVSDNSAGRTGANSLLRTVMRRLTWRVSFDTSCKLRLVNRARTLVGASEGRLLGSTAEELGLGGCLEGEAAHTME